MDEERTRALAALEDRASQAARAEVCRLLGPAFDSAGKLLWMLGSIVGADRVEGRSPFGHGSDATVGVAILAQIAGQLISASVRLLDADNLYAALALIRQLVEVEYLAWAFAEDHAEAESWLRSTKDERLGKWQPRHLRERSQGRFRGKDYGYHCEVGGHPTPDAVQVLPEHSARSSASWWWLELAIHGVSVWDYMAAAGAVLGHGDWYAEHVVMRLPGELWRPRWTIGVRRTEGWLRGSHGCARECVVSQPGNDGRPRDARTVAAGRPPRAAARRGRGRARRSEAEPP